ncbi:MAG: DUF2612 domain-containing protein [Saprospiraceae bacterium]
MGQPRIREILASILQEYQDLEYVAADLKDLKDLSSATGDQLDILGGYVGEARQGKNDDDYREAIQLRAFLNASHGEPETIIRYVKVLTNAIDVTYLDLFPAKVLLQVVTNEAVTTEIVAKLQKIAPAGVKIILEFVQEGDVFGFDGEGGFPPAANIAGFGEEGVGNDGIGGKFFEEL